MMRTRAKTLQQPLSRERLVAVVVFLFAMGLLFIFSVRATEIGTNITVTGDLFGTTTVQATHNMIAYRHFLSGTTSPANLDQIGAQFATSTYFAKFVGIGDATYLGDGNLKVQNDIFASSTIYGTGLGTFIGGVLGQGSSTISDLLSVNQFSASSTVRLTGLLSTASSTIGSEFFVTEGIHATGTIHGGGLNVGNGTDVAKILLGTCAVNPPVLKGGTGSTTSCTATGVTTSDKVLLIPPLLDGWDPSNNNNGGLALIAASTTAADTVTIQIANTSTSTALDGASRTWNWWAWQ